MSFLQYELEIKDIPARLLTVRCKVAKPASEGQYFQMPAWTPGSYKIRDYARHIISVRAYVGAREVAVEQTDKQTWRCEPASGELCFEYDVYAADLSIRGSYVDSLYTFLHGASVWMQALGQSLPCRVLLLQPQGLNWTVATPLKVIDKHAKGFGSYEASDYEELLDQPIVMGELTVIKYSAEKVPHHLVLLGVHNADEKRLQKDLTTICSHHIKFFGKPAPMSHYYFFLKVLGKGQYGGIEHRDSSSLVIGRENLPFVGMPDDHEPYIRLLGLFSHEYFHAWMVKRIKPKEFIPYDLTKESYTKLLWVFEGITSYYDELALVRSTLINKQRYLILLGELLTRLKSTAGRKLQTVAQSSFTTWTKFYQQDENAVNAIVSYYTKGAVIALCLDLLIRKHSTQEKSLDDVVRLLWQRFGKAGEGVTENTLLELSNEVSGADLTDFFNLALNSCDELPVDELLAEVNIKTNWLTPLQAKAANNKSVVVEPSWGVKAENCAQGVKLLTVLNDGSAQRAGLAAGDIVIAINGIKAELEAFQEGVIRFSMDEALEVFAFRQDELRKFSIKLLAAKNVSCIFKWQEDSSIDPCQWLQ